MLPLAKELIYLLLMASLSQYAADNVDHNSRTLDGHDTFHGMGMIAVVTPGTKFSRNVTRRKVSSEEISATGKVEIHHMRAPTSERGDQI